MTRVFFALAILASAAFSCSRDKAAISGTFTGNGECTVYLEQTTTREKSIIDSVRTDKRGNFKFKVKLSDGNPAFYNILCHDSRIPLLLSAGEKVDVRSMCNLVHNYTVSGSEGSELLREFNSMYSNSLGKMDSISNLFVQAGDSLDKEELTREYSSAYYGFKRGQIKFIVSNAASMASIYALYQRLPNDRYLFDGSSDIIYYKLVADSLSNHYPSSPHVKLLQKEIADAENAMAIGRMISSRDSATVTGYPDISMNDIYGKKQTLSALKDKVVLVDFTTSSEPRLNMLNAELKNTYRKFADKGFEVYQVSLESSKPQWVLSVQEQKLPWINVSDLRGTGSAAAAAYNIRSIPANFLIDRKGEIVGKDLYGEELAEKLSQLLN